MKEYFGDLREILYNIHSYPTAMYYDKQYRMELKQQGFFTIQHKKISATHKNDENIFISIHETSHEKNMKVPIFHIHDFFELIYIYRGFALCSFKNSSVNLNSGNFLLIQPNILHGFNLLGENTTTINIHIPKEVFFNYISPIMSKNPILGIFTSRYSNFSNIKKDYILFPVDDNENSKIVSYICQEFINKNHMYQSSLQALVSFLLLQISRQSVEYYELTDLESGYEDRIQTILDYIEMNCNTVTLSDLQKEFSYSTSYLSRIIKQVTGKTFTEIQTHFRLQKAKDLLEVCTLQIHEISYELGYLDAQYFSRIFKNKYGESPLNYRKLSKKFK